MLGIEPTKDIRLIKRAYAAKLKVYHPEEDPQGYQALREAYDWAVEQSKRIELTETIDTIETEETIIPRNSFSGAFDEWEMDEEENEEDQVDQADQADQVDEIDEVDDESVLSIPLVINESDDEDQDHGENVDEDSLKDLLTTPPRLVYDLNLVAPDPQEHVSMFMEKVEKLYADFPKRMNESYWLELLQDSVMWDISVSEGLYEEVSEFFEDHHFLPLEIWKILNQSFNWTDKFNEDPDEFKEYFLEIYHRAIKCLPEYLLSYDTLLHVEGIDFDLYLQYREEIAIALVSQELDDARSSIYHAQHVFDNDPILDQLVCQYCRLAEDITWGLEVSERSIQRNPQLMDMRLHHAYFYYRSGKIAKALVDVDYILLTEPSHMGAMSLAIKCYMEQAQLDKAEDMSKRLLELAPNDIEAVSSLAVIYQHKLDNKSYNNKQRRQLRSHVGKGMTFSQRIVKSMDMLRIRLVFVLIAIVMQVFMIIEVKNDLGMSLPQYLRSDYNTQHDIQTITNSDEMQVAFNFNRPVELSITNSRYMGLNRVYHKDEEQFMKTQEAKDRELFKNGSGYVSIGYFGDQTVLVVTDYQQSKEIYDHKEITLVGQLKPLTGSNLEKAFGTWASERSGELRNAAYVLDHPISTYYVDTQETVDTTLYKVVKDWTPYMIILGLLYLYTINEAIKLWRWLRYV